MCTLPLLAGENVSAALVPPHVLCSPGRAGYQNKTTREIPLVLLQP